MNDREDFGAALLSEALAITLAEKGTGRPVVNRASPLPPTSKSRWPKPLATLPPGNYSKRPRGRGIGGVRPGFSGRIRKTHGRAPHPSPHGRRHGHFPRQHHVWVDPSGIPDFHHHEG